MKAILRSVLIFFNKLSRIKTLDFFCLFLPLPFPVKNIAYFHSKDCRQFWYKEQEVRLAVIQFGNVGLLLWSIWEVALMVLIHLPVVGKLWRNSAAFMAVMIKQLMKMVQQTSSMTLQGKNGDWVMVCVIYQDGQNRTNWHPYSCSRKTFLRES